MSLTSADLQTCNAGLCLKEAEIVAEGFEPSTTPAASTQKLGVAGGAAVHARHQPEPEALVLNLQPAHVLAQIQRSRMKSADFSACV